MPRDTENKRLRRSGLAEEPCGRGHTEGRYPKSRNCIACMRERNKRLFEKDPAAAAAKVKAWREANPEKSRASKRRSSIKRKYGLTPEDIFRMMAKQSGKCAICDRMLDPSTCNGMHIDHCHATGRVRGLLCGCCNTSIGKLGDDVKGLRRALDYLEGDRLHCQVMLHT